MQSLAPAHIPERASPLAADHWNWRKKLSNYLNICRIGKSSRLLSPAPYGARKALQQNQTPNQTRTAR